MFILLLFTSLVFVDCKSGDKNVNQSKINKGQQSDPLSLTLFDYNNLVEVKNNIKSEKYSTSFQKLIREADQALNDTVFSVTYKKLTPPSGDKHDYISYGPYWWPDPEKSDGLPWIRRDGEVNPLSRDNNTDYTEKATFFNNVSDLSWAFFFSDNKEYATKLKELLDVWFLDEDTKMNPNLNFAQGIPGINDGRGIGIIDFAGITKVITAIEILEIKNAIDPHMSVDLRNWLSGYLNWLQTSKNGIFERDTKNNHGTYYDLQVVSLHLFLGNKEGAREVLETAKLKRIASQIEPDGKQPHELARTKSLSYSTMNLKGMTQLAIFGTKVGVDLWNYSPQNAGNIKQAYEFLKPYAMGEKEWTYEQINSKEKAIKSLKQLYLKAGCEFGISEYEQIGRVGDNITNSLFESCN